MIPLLHSNTISFFGMKKRSHYLGLRKINDKLIGLDKSGTITVWSSKTGKILGSNKLANNQSFSNYEVFEATQQEGM